MFSLFYDMIHIIKFSEQAEMIIQNKIRWMENLKLGPGFAALENNKKTQNLVTKKRTTQNPKAEKQIQSLRK